ncbi:MAG TPA: hypothetical protein VD883_01690 [Candidatus Omnitrophota bacterium]|nr:hypothetical protein [Candidatus Omnitrophota bacterium]
MEATLFWTIGIFAVLGLIAVIFGAAVILSLWWLFVPVLGALWAGWFGFFCGVGLVILIGALRRSKRKR